MLKCINGQLRKTGRRCHRNYASEKLNSKSPFFSFSHCKTWFTLSDLLLIQYYLTSRLKESVVIDRLIISPFLPPVPDVQHLTLKVRGAKWRAQPISHGIDKGEIKLGMVQSARYLE
jgi:hypothetical protein